MNFFRLLAACTTSLTPSLVIVYIAFLFANLGLFATYAILVPSSPHDNATLVVAACAYDSPNAGANLPLVSSSLDL